MKKLILIFFACLLAIMGYANTCTFDGVDVSLQSETMSVSKIGYPASSNGWITITVSDKSKKEVRCQVDVDGMREWITVKLSNGKGSFNLGYEMDLKVGTYTVKLIQRGGMCY